MPLKINDTAPNFTLFDADKKERSLSEFAGRTVVLAFFPAAFTSVCTKEMCEFRDWTKQFANSNAQILGICVDGPFTNKAFIQANEISFPILSDYSRAVSTQYCGVYNDFAGMKGYTAAKRSVFVIGKDSKVRYAWISENPGAEPLYAEIKQALL